MQNNGSKLVYSTSLGAICPECARARKDCRCRELRNTAVPATDGVARLRYELNGRKGKGVTLISGLSLSHNELVELSGKLKRQFATGGAVKEGAIQLQGDFRLQAAEKLRELGFKVK